MTGIKLVEFSNTDNIKLPGLLYKPAKKTKKVLINLHGNGSASVFYSVERSNTFGEYLNKARISFFTFNNVGAHYIKKLKKIEGEEEEEMKLGTAYELIKDCIQDIDGAVRFLRRLGYKEFYLMGHSTGANKICVYNYYKSENVFTKYILESGGDDTGMFYKFMGKKKFNLALKKCRKYIEEGNGDKLIPKYLMNYIISYKSLYDTINPDGDYNVFPFNEVLNNLELSKKKLFREIKSIKIPTSVIYGENDEYCYGHVKRCIRTIKEAVRGKRNFDYRVIKNADHGFHGKEIELVKAVVNWLK